ncbi:MAG: DUF1580 domain-containing protein [Planctomycetes bacterium]|nr:DUF1580 domain-containing protein [Planctomycetota bacterium]
MTTHDITQSLVDALDEGKRDQLFKLLAGSSIVEELTGNRPHRSALHRWASKGVAGVRLQTVCVGRCRYTTRRWLIEFFAAVDLARREGEASSSGEGESARGVRRRTSEVEEEVLARHGLSRSARTGGR